MPRSLAVADEHVVAVEGDVELAEGDLGPGEVGDPTPEALREGDTAGVDPDQREARQVGVALDELVRDPGQRLRDRVSVEDDLGCRGLRGYGALRAYFTFDSFPASRDRLKGVLCRRATYTLDRTATATSHSTR